MRFLLLVLIVVASTACGGDPPAHAVADSGTDGDTDTDVDTDNDVDADGDSDTDADTETNTDPDLLDWVAIPGGSYWMGCDESECSSAEHPLHEVTVPSFEMTRSEVTMGQYAACVDDGACTEPMPDTYTPPDFEDWEPYVTWGTDDYEDHPINCVNWFQAVAFCEWAGGRLPSEAEWEYAARSLGQDRMYPWGEAEPTCEYAIMAEDGGWEDMACANGTTWPVCSKSAGNTEQGLCDMAGGMAEMVQDCYHYGYEGAPSTAEPWMDNCEMAEDESRVVRGGDFSVYQPVFLRTSMRDYTFADFWFAYVGFRCAR